MVILANLYAFLSRLVLSTGKLVRWGWLEGRLVDVTPNISGQEQIEAFGMLARIRPIGAVGVCVGAIGTIAWFSSASVRISPGRDDGV